MKYQIGDKVVPISKTAKGWESEDFQQSMKAKAQGYLYVVGVNVEDCRDNIMDYSCDCISTSGGNFYNEEDLVPYEEPFVLPEKWAFEGCKESIDWGKNTPQWKWFNEKSGRNYGFYSSCYYYSDGSYSCNTLKEGYIEITFKQFQEHI